MNNEAIVAETSRTIPTWLLTSGAARVLILLSLGSERTVLSWGETKKTVSLDQVNEVGEVVKNIFESDITSLQKAAFYRSTIYLTVGGVRHQLLLRDTRVNNKGVMDARWLDPTGTALEMSSAYIEVKSNLDAFKAFLVSNNVDIFQRRVSAKTRLTFGKWLLIIAPIVLVLGVVIAFIIGRVGS